MKTEADSCSAFPSQRKPRMPSNHGELEAAREDSSLKPQREQGPADILTLGFSSPEPWENKFLLFEANQSFFFFFFYRSPRKFRRSFYKSYGNRCVAFFFLVFIYIDGPLSFLYRYTSVISSGCVFGLLAMTTTINKSCSGIGKLAREFYNYLPILPETPGFWPRHRGCRGLR